MSARPALEIRLGSSARAHIERNGLHVDDLRGITMAAGGPKWFILAALDRWLFNEFLPARQTPLPLLGASIGSWQLAAGIADGGRAIDQLAAGYMGQSFRRDDSPEQVTGAARELLTSLFSKQRQQRILQHPQLQLQVMAVRSTGLTSGRLGESAGFALSAMAQTMRAEWLQFGFRRHVFTRHKSATEWLQRPGWETEQSQLDDQNLLPALLASACIPSVMAGVVDPAHAPSGIYRDGGVSDYHIPLHTEALDGPVLMPHFTRDLKPGWFDKFLPWRRFGQAQTDWLIVLNPAKAFAASLPGGKIPDRHDFLTMPDDIRRQRWRHAVDAGERMVDDLRQWMVDGCPADATQPL
jgi:hypothetical protein